MNNQPLIQTTTDKRKILRFLIEDKKKPFTLELHISPDRKVFELRLNNQCLKAKRRDVILATATVENTTLGNFYLVEPGHLDETKYLTFLNDLSAQLYTENDTSVFVSLCATGILSITAKYNNLSFPFSDSKKDSQESNLIIYNRVVTRIADAMKHLCEEGYNSLRSV